MNRIKIIPLLFALMLSANIANANQFETTSNNFKAPVLLNWSQSDKGLSLDVFSDNKNGEKFIFVLSNNLVVASGTISSSTQFSLRRSFEIKMPLDGIYEYYAMLCHDNLRKNCSVSIPESVSIKNGLARNEIDLDNDDLSEERKEILDSNIILKYRTLFESNIYKNTKLELGVALKSKKQNIEVARKIIQSGALSTILYNIKGFNTEGFEKILVQNPRFCGEEGLNLSLELSCARDLSAYVTYLLYFTNDKVKNEYVGVGDASKLNALTGVEGRALLSNESSTNEFLADLMDWYMKPRSPEPDPHSMLLGLHLLNDNDRQNNIKYGFGSTINIASHSSFCSGAGQGDKELSELYVKILTKTGFSDKANLSCLNQKAFGINGSAYFPQYVKIDKTNNACSLSSRQLPNSIYDKAVFDACNKDGKISELIISGVTDAFRIKDRTNGSVPISSLKQDVDKRVLFGRKISATYPIYRAYNKDTQPSLIPFSKTNEIVFEGGVMTKSGKLEFVDNYLMTEMPFAGDCLRADCKNGLLNQMSQIRQKYKHEEIVLQILIDKDSPVDSKEKKANFITSLEEFLVRNSYVNGIQFKVDHISSEKSGDDIRHLIALTKSMISGSSSQGVNKTGVSLAIPIQSRMMQDISLPNILSMINSVYLISYDSHLTSENLTAHNAQIISLPSDKNNFSLANGLLQLKKAKAVEKQIVISVPFYGRIWNNVVAKEGEKYPGLSSPHKTEIVDNKVDYKTLSDYYIGKGSYQYYEDSILGASYVYDGENFISYDSPEIIKQKMDYIYKDGYQGILLGDIMADNGSLTEKVLQVISKGEQNLACNIKRVIKKDVKDGDRNADVFALQSYLKCLGYFPQHMDVNGFFGFSTKNAVKEFQKDNALLPTGLVDEKTRNLVQTKV